MTQLSNQFRLSTEKGTLDQAINVNILPCKIDPASVADFSGSNAFAVKLVDVAGSGIIVDKATAITDSILGFVVYSTKTNSPVAGDYIRVASTQSVMFMEASAAIARGADLEINLTGDKVATQATGTSIGTALDKVAADGDLVRVLIKTL